MVKIIYNRKAKQFLVTIPKALAVAKKLEPGTRMVWIEDRFGNLTLKREVIPKPVPMFMKH